MCLSKNTERNVLMKILKVILKTFCIVLASLITLILLVWGALAVARFGIYPDYYAQGEHISKIPALGCGFVPQGLAYHKETDTYFHSGYHGANIELFLVNGDTVREIVLLTMGGEQATGHGDGVSIVGDYLYIADCTGKSAEREGFLRVYRLADILNAEDGDAIRETDHVILDSPASFCFSDGRYMYVGEFYRANNYETREFHHFTTPAGDENKAIFLAYPLGTDGAITKDTRPEFAVSITSLVQGIAVTEDGTVMLSRSWGLNDSHIEFHSGWKDSGNKIAIGDNTLPLYYLDSSTMTRDLIMPAFSEALVIIDDKVAVSFESACNKYIVGKFFFSNNVVAFQIN